MSDDVSRTLTVELEVDTRGRVTGPTDWVKRRVNVGRLLGAGRG